MSQRGLDGVAWPDAAALLAAVDASAELDRLVGRGHPLGDARRWADWTMATAPLLREGTFDPVGLELSFRSTDPAGPTAAVDVGFPITLPELRDLTALVLKSLTAYSDTHDRGNLVATVDDLLQAGGPDGFEHWLSDHAVGHDTSYSCTPTDPPPDSAAAARLAVDFEGFEAETTLPLPFSLWSFRDLAAALSDVVHGEWERVMYGYGWGSENYSEFRSLEVLPWLRDLFDETAPGGNSEAVELAARPWAENRIDAALAELPDAALRALGLTRSAIIDDLVAAVVDDAWLAEDAPDDSSGFDAERSTKEPATGPGSTTLEATGVAARDETVRPFSRTLPVPSTHSTQRPSWLSRHPHAAPCLASAVLLLFALGAHPYGYYQLLRWVVCASAALVVWCCADWRKELAPAPQATADVLAVLGVGVALLFNPLVPVNLERTTWAPLDLLAAAYIGAAAALLERPAEGRPPAAVR